jgi:hypothetical protein
MVEGSATPPVVAVAATAVEPAMVAGAATDEADPDPATVTAAGATVAGAAVPPACAVPTMVADPATVAGAGRDPA